jgi:hypothetical protein
MILTQAEKICDNILKSGKLDIETMKKNHCVVCRKVNRILCRVLLEQNREKEGGEKNGKT